MRRTDIIKKGVGCGLAALFLTVVSFGEERPSVVLIIGDDISPDFSCFGGQVPTPNIDQLAAGGVRFENAYVTASSCSPSRCSIITGRYPHNTGAPELHMELPEGQFLFPLALKESGYYCAQSGKWHVGESAKQAFDDFYEFEGATGPGREDRWVSCLQERPKDKPFFMWFAATDAHRPWQADPEGVPFNPAEVILPAGVPDTPVCREDMACYYDEVQRFDRYVGKVVDELKAQGVFDSTLLIVLGDNGRPFPRNKTTLYDNGMKTPLVAHWPDGMFKRGAVSQSLVSSVDIVPAILEAAGLPVPPQVQGINLLPICRQPDLQTRRVLFGERNWHGQRGCGRMVREGNYVYIRDFTPGCFSFQMVEVHHAGAYAELLRLKAEGVLTDVEAEEFSTNRVEELLFNVSEDPQQLNNLADNPEQANILNRLRAALNIWQDQTGDSIPSVEDMTPERHNRETYERLYPSKRPPQSGIVSGQVAGAAEINNPGPF